MIGHATLLRLIFQRVSTVTGSKQFLISVFSTKTMKPVLSILSVLIILSAFSRGEAKNSGRQASMVDLISCSMVPTLQVHIVGWSERFQLTIRASSPEWWEVLQRMEIGALPEWSEILESLWALPELSEVASHQPLPEWCGATVKPIQTLTRLTTLVKDFEYCHLNTRCEQRGWKF